MKTVGGILLVSLVSLLWGAPLSVEALQGRVQGALQTETEETVQRLDITFRPLPTVTNWPDKSMTLNIRVPDRPYGMIVVPVEWVAKERQFQIPVQVMVKAFDQVMVCARSIDRKAVIRDKDIQSETREVTSILSAGKTLIRRSDQLVGKRVKTFLKKGDVLTAEGVESVPDVLKGQLVTLVMVKGAIEVSLSARAEEEGCIGDVILVKCAKTKASMKAHIESATLVRAEG